jgi:hypothetical protein
MATFPVVNIRPRVLPQSVAPDSAAGVIQATDILRQEDIRRQQAELRREEIESTQGLQRELAGLRGEQALEQIGARGEVQAELAGEQREFVAGESELERAQRAQLFGEEIDLKRDIETRRGGEFEREIEFRNLESLRRQNVDLARLNANMEVARLNRAGRGTGLPFSLSVTGRDLRDPETLRRLNELGGPFFDVTDPSATTAGEAAGGTVTTPPPQPRGLTPEQQGAMQSFQTGTEAAQFLLRIPDPGRQREALEAIRDPRLRAETEDELFRLRLQEGR